MGLLDQFSPTQRTALLVGVPAVAGVVLYQSARGGSSSEAEPTTPPTADFVTPTTDAIGTGTVANFFTDVTDILAGLTTRVGDLENKGTTTPPPATTPGRRALKIDYARNLETPTTLAIRLRKTTPTTPAGLPLTASYLISVNKWAAKGIYTNSRLWTGMTVRY